MKGVYTALVTPFTPEKKIDWDALRSLIVFQSKQKITGLVIAGTTAETATLSSQEKKDLYVFAKKEAEKFSLDLIAGTGTNNTAETIEWTKYCSSVGYRKFLVVTPYYNKPNQRGIEAHFSAVADEANGGDIILYNVPGRTLVSITPETLANLAEKPNIIGIKEATGNMTFASELREKIKRPSFAFLSGDDPTYFPFLCLGGAGTISVASHLVGADMENMTHMVLDGKIAEARSIHERLFPLMQALFIDTNPAPVKWILSQLGVIGPDLRLPLLTVSKEIELKLKPFADALKPQLGR